MVRMSTFWFRPITARTQPHLAKMKKILHTDTQDNKT